MHFIPFKDVKRFSRNITASNPDQDIYTTTADSLIFVTAYSNGAASYNEDGIIYFEYGTFPSPWDRVILWRGLDHGDPNGTFDAFFGHSGGGSIVPAGKTIRHDNLFIAGTIIVNIYIMELNEQDLI